MNKELACVRIKIARNILFVTLTYFVVGWLGLRMPFDQPYITLFWLPTGIAVAALLRCGWIVWPGIFLGDFLVNYSVSPDGLLATSIAVGNTLGPALTANLLNRADFQPNFDRARDIGLFVAAGALGMVVPALSGVIILHAAGQLPLSAIAPSWLTWWMGDAVGVMLTTPLLLNLSWKSVRELCMARIEITLWLVISVIVAWLAFYYSSDKVVVSLASLPLKFLTLPPLMWAFLRFGKTGAGLAALGFSFIATLATARGHGFVLGPYHRASLIILWLYILTVVMTEFLIATVQSRSVKALQALRESEINLRVAAAAFDAQVGILITDSKSKILQINKAFSDISGYALDEVIGRTPKLFRSGRHDDAFYASMWTSINQTGFWQGEIWDRRKNGEVYPKWMTITAVKAEDGAVVNYVSTQFDATGTKAAEEEIRNLSFYDSLTNLPNRKLLIDRLRQALAASARNGRTGALYFVDLDHFKTLNDTLGHELGDRLLQEVGKRLACSVRESDTVARLGGDEFVIMQEGLGSKLEEAVAHARIVGDKIIDAFREPFELGDIEGFSTPSIGIVLFQDHKDRVDDLLKRADLAMYQAKTSGRNTLRFFDSAMQEVANARATLEADLRHGLQHGEFLLYYQPQMNADARMTGVEVLLRWMHPQRGMISPLDFIPLAEETGQILPLGRSVLEAACLKLASWAAEPETDHLEVAVNISARQFHHPDFVEEVLEIVKRTGADPKLLILELTESILLTNLDEVTSKMNLLRASGICFSLDDFGTGYSSLAYLKRLPLTQLKIDRSFVMDVLTDTNDAAIAKTILALGQSLGLSVIAEGIETDGQLKFLVEHGCHAFQGFLFSRPLSADNLDAFIFKNC